MTSLAPPPYNLESASLPSDYVKYDPALLPLPTQRYVGLLSCQSNPLLRTLKTKIVASASSAPAAPAAATNGKPQKTRKAATDKPAVAGQGLIWEVECQDTVLFPEGGGQPSDTGVMRLVGSGKQIDFKVLHVLRSGLRAIHYVQIPIEYSGDDLSIGSDVELIVDWERRMDLMTHHTIQHLLSALLDLIPIPTLSWSLTPFPSPSYVELGRAPTASEIAVISSRAAQLITSATRTSLEVAPQTSPDVYDSRQGIPKDYQGGVLRTVVIDKGVDRNACCGTHLVNLAMSGGLHILPTTIAHTKNSVRLYFLSGERLRLYTESSSAILADLMKSLGGMLPEKMAGRVDGLLGDVKEGLKREKNLMEELAGEVSVGVKERLEDAKVAGKKGVIVSRNPTSTATHSIAFLSALATLAMPTAGAEVLLLSSAMKGEETMLLVSGNTMLVDRIGQCLKESEALKGRVKGGGKGKWQAKVGGRWGQEEEDALENVLDGL